ncbi:DUF29 domain-containing protein [Lichenifustis flavocetrariae]|uniref:DUF29 domain-containing protein n=1 Tax=Lichenifustis flavocetrariae TaxID=2949735 RepID=A0AA41YS78_9HYPH|nr:DUF29 domain-containing protein [Lichenifustis flavocetrariae]MCW6507604.1 DUF29 domain-containing protein [Lichenifustis flavocetrariae]
MAAQDRTGAMGQNIRKSSNYNEDFHQWTQDQAQLLRSGQLREADIDNIAEELESLGRSEANALRSHLKQIICHLLKLAHQPERATRSWTNTIARARQDVEDILEDNPSLRSRLPALFDKASRDGRILAILETGLAPTVVPAAHEFTMEQVRNPAFLPGRFLIDLPSGQTRVEPVTPLSLPEPDDAG